jgi:hypothetical protein
MKLETLESYLFTVYVHEKRLSSRTVGNLRFAARQFDAFAGPIQTLDEGHVDRFREWLINHGKTMLTASAYRESAKTIARHWFPNGPWGHVVVFLDADVPGTLDCVFLRQFVHRNGRRVNDADTHRRYGQTFKLFTQFLGRPATLADLETRRVSEFLEWLKKTQRIGNWAVGHHAMRIGSLWCWACRSGLIENPPTWREVG